MSKILYNEVSKLLEVESGQVESVMMLTNEGCTIPFISRYRKEATGQLDEVKIDEIIKTFKQLEELEKRRSYIISFLKKENKLTAILKKNLTKANSLNELEDIYLPFKPRKKTLADKAVEFGLTPLAEKIKNGISEQEISKLAKSFVNDEVEDVDSAITHAMNIVIQEYSDSADVRKFVRENLKKGNFSSGVKRGKKEIGSKYKDYFEFTEPLDKMASHRVMAIVRGSNEGILNLSVFPSEKSSANISKNIAKLLYKKDSSMLVKAADESLDRYINKSIGNDIIKNLKGIAELDSVAIFSKNLEKILLSAPFGEKAVIGIDPGIRTGCKAVVLNENGEYVEFTTLYLHSNVNDLKKIIPWIDKYNIKGISIGDGTFGRETFKMVSELLDNRDIAIVLVDEDGASVYSASEAARDEFPKLDVVVRGAISIGRRFQDPLAELVKIDPKSLGVGQYQHDITPNLLKENLTKTVEWAVNSVGVNVNTASYHLLSFISGLDLKKAKEIVNYRKSVRRIKKSSEIKKIKGIGEKAYQQSSGFLRIYNGEQILDESGVHPESYKDVIKISDYYNVSVEELIENPSIIEKNVIKLKLKILELDSIVDELKLKGLDPRKEFHAVEFDNTISNIDDLTLGMNLNGVVDNVLAFGAFIDIGIKDKGLVHISEVSNTFVKDINEVLSIGDEVVVKIISIDKDRGRISLSIKQAI